MDKAPLRAMTYNIRFDNPADSLDTWSLRKDYLISQVAFWSPDVLGIQEALIHQLSEMKEGLKGYAFFGKGRDSGGTEGEHTAIFYKTRRLTLLQQGTFWLSERPEKPSKGWDAALNRTCTYGQFRLNESKQVFWVFNTHFDHKGPLARANSVALILRKMKELNMGDEPAILMGDLNLEPESKPIKKLEASLDDIYLLAGDKAHGPTGTFNGFDTTLQPTRRIDYIFLSPDAFHLDRMATLSETRGRGYPSDHFPVYSELRFRN